MTSLQFVGICIGAFIGLCIWWVFAACIVAAQADRKHEAAMKNYERQIKKG